MFNRVQVWQGQAKILRRNSKLALHIPIFQPNQNWDNNAKTVPPWFIPRNDDCHITPIFQEREKHR